MATIADYKQDIIEGTKQILASGIMPKSVHGNVSFKLPDQDAFLLTAGGSLANMQPENIALFQLDGTLIEGTVMPVGAEIIQMHGIVYRTRPEFSSVVHTHSPFATAWAVAAKAIPPAYEAMVRNGITEGVPVAPYGPRGSDESVRNIEEQLKQYQGIKAVLLANHGVLAFEKTVNGAVRANVTIEESAEIMLYAMSLGGAKPLPAAKIEETRERAAAFAAQGNQQR